MVEMIPRASCAKTVDMRVITETRWTRPNIVKLKQIRVINSSNKHTASQSRMQTRLSEVSWHLESWAKMDCCMCIQPYLVLALNFNFTPNVVQLYEMCSYHDWVRDVFWQMDMDEFVLISLWVDSGGKRGPMLGNL